MPEQPEFSKERQRPTQNEIENRVKSFLDMKTRAPEFYQEAIRDLKSLASEADANNEALRAIKNRYYPGWEPEDFKELLRRLGEIQTPPEESKNDTLEEERSGKENQLESIIRDIIALRSWDFDRYDRIISEISLLAKDQKNDPNFFQIRSKYPQDLTPKDFEKILEELKRRLGGYL